MWEDTDHACVICDLFCCFLVAVHKDGWLGDLTLLSHGVRGNVPTWRVEPLAWSSLNPKRSVGHRSTRESFKLENLFNLVVSFLDCLLAFACVPNVGANCGKTLVYGYMGIWV